MKTAILILFSIVLSYQLSFHFSGLTCPEGTTISAKPDKTPSSNGCGSAAYQVKMGKALNPYSSKFRGCCDAHDICFTTCNSSKDALKKCNSDFKSCMKNKCKKESVIEKPICNTYATSYYTFVD